MTYVTKTIKLAHKFQKYSSDNFSSITQEDYNNKLSGFKGLINRSADLFKNMVRMKPQMSDREKMNFLSAILGSIKQTSLRDLEILSTGERSAWEEFGEYYPGWSPEDIGRLYEDLCSEYESAFEECAREIPSSE